MSRELDTVTLDNAARDYAGQFLLPSTFNPDNPKQARGGRAWVMQSLEALHFEDEFKYLNDHIPLWLGPKAVAEYKEAVAKAITPYDAGELKQQLEVRLGQDENGKPIPGKLGKVQRGGVIIGWRYRSHRWLKGTDGKKVQFQTLLMPRLVKGSVHIGETEEQAIARLTALHVKHGEVIFPMSSWPLSMMALNTRISNEAALGACDYVVDRLDEGSAAAIVQGRTGAQPADPDTAVSGTLLFTLVCSDPAFGNAADANPGGRATASAITADSSADATGTLGYCRASATNDNATSLDDHIDGEAGTSGADFNFNTVSIVSGANISLSSWTVTMPES